MFKEASVLILHVQWFNDCVLDIKNSPKFQIFSKFQQHSAIQGHSSRVNISSVDNSIGQSFF
jgi:hypothetical protein